MRRLAVAAFLLQVAALAVVAVVGTRSGEDLVGLWQLVVFSFAVLGLLILWRQPRNTLAWFLLAVIGTVAVVPGLLDAYVLQGTVAAPGSLPGVGVAAAVGQGGWALSVGGIGILLVLLFPDGRLPSRRWRWLAWTGPGAIALVVVASALVPGPLTEGPAAGRTNPLGLEDQKALVVTFMVVSFVVLAACIVAAASAMVMRFRASHGVERLQLKWFALAATLAGSVLPVGMALWDLSTLVSAVMASSLLSLPVAMGVAVMRHHLYDIDVVIKRTLVYGSLTASLAVVYLAVVLTLRSLGGAVTGDSDLAVAASTLVVAALFRPLRTRIQRAVDHRFYRRAYDAAVTVDSFSDRLRQEVDLDAVTADLRDVVSETMQPAHLSLWLRGAS